MIEDLILLLNAVVAAISKIDSHPFGALVVLLIFLMLIVHTWKNRP